MQAVIANPVHLMVRDGAGSDIGRAAVRLRAAALLTLTLLLAALLPPTKAAAADPATTMIVLDGSGSMWGRIAGDRDSKFATTREALRKTLPRLGPQTRVGLAAFGHRRKADCSDTEIMLAPEPLDSARILAPLDKFNPKGKGPLVAAVRETAAVLAKSSGPASMIVIHDDPDNCAQDPCAAADEIAKAGGRIAVHVISLGLARSDAQRMACLARTTGGRHFEISDASALVPALEEAFKLAGSASPAAPATAALRPAAAAAVEPPKPAPPAADTGPPALKFAATLGQGGPAVIVPLLWRVRKAGDGAAGGLVASLRSPTLDVELTPGAYVVEVAHGLVKASAPVEVKLRGATQGTIALQAGAVRVSAVLQKGMPALEQAVFSIVEPQPAGGGAPRTVWSGGADAPPVILPVGIWRVTAELDRARADSQIPVTAGALVDAVLPLGAGRLHARAIDRDGGAPLDPVLFKVTEDDADSADGRREIARSTASEPEFTLPAGTYYLSARQGQAEVRERVLVNAGDDVTRTVLLPIGRVTLQSRLAGAAAALESHIAYRITRLDARQDPIRIGRAAARVELPAGRYRIESELGVQNARIAREIDVRQGTQTTLSFEHMVANVQLKIASSGRSAGSELLWDVRDAQDRSVWQAFQGEPRAFLAPGRYKVLLESRDRRGRAEVELKAGETRVLEVVLE